MYKYFSAVVALSTAFVATQASAIPFDNTSGTTATVVVDAAGGGDYTSLKAASQAFNAVATINRPWLLLINSDLTEPARIAFGTNVASGASLTVKPAPTKTPTVTLSNVTPYTNSFYGAIVIGCNDSGITDTAGGADPTAASIFETNNAFIFDGSNTTGGTTRDLTFKIGATGDVTGYIMRVVGTTNGFVLKNCNLVNLRSSSNANVIGFGAGNIAGFGSQGGDYKSDNAVIENNYMEAKATSSGTSGIGVNYSVSAFGALTAPKNFEGHIIRNCVFDVRHRGISALYQVNCLYSGNEFHIRTNANGANSGAIQHLLQNGTYPTSYTVTCVNNKILDLQTSNTTAGDYGVNGIACNGGTNARYRVFNNVITGVISGGATSVDQLITGIWGTGGSSIYEIEHNSINIGPQANVTGATRTRAAGIAINASQNTTENYVKNNNIRYAVGKGAPIVVYASGGTPIATTSIAGNNLFQAVSSDPASPVAYVGGALSSTTAYADQTGLSGAGYNLGGGQSVDPAATNPAWGADLSFASVPPTLGVTAASTVLYDINNQPRGAANSFPGAYRIAASSVNDWSVY